MKYSATFFKQCKTYNETMEYVAQKYFGGTDFGKKFIKTFGTYLEKEKFPTDQIVVNPFTGNNRFDITLKYNGEYLCRLNIEVANADYRFMQIYKQDFKVKEMENFFLPTIKRFFEKYKADLFKRILIANNIEDFTKTKIDVVVDDYTDYNKNGKQTTLNDTLENIFESYTTHNDRLKYINGSYWRFNNKNIENLYHIFIETYNGNYFLDNAVKRGVLID